MMTDKLREQVEALNQKIFDLQKDKAHDER